MNRFLRLLLACLVCAACKKTPTQPAPAPREPEEKAVVAGDDLGYGADVQTFATAKEAIRAIVKESKPAVLGFGEYHKLADSPPVQSALRRFTREILDVVGPNTGHLVLETWGLPTGCGPAVMEVAGEVTQTIRRPDTSEEELVELLREVEGLGIRGQVLEFSCSEYGKLRGDAGLDYDELLVAIGAKLGEAAFAAYQSMNQATGAEPPFVVVYGGATHNDLSPYAGLESWSYGPKLAAATNHRYVEVDLYVPEFVEGDQLLTKEAWYPLMQHARSNRVILIRRTPHSFILLLKSELQ